MRLWDTPVPIPNTMVKTQAADDTLLETARESRWMPAYKKEYSKENESSQSCLYIATTAKAVHIQKQTERFYIEGLHESDVMLWDRILRRLFGRENFRIVP